MSLLRQVTKIPGVRAVWRRLPIGSVSVRAHFGIDVRPQYMFGVYKAAEQARSLEIKKMAVVEFGVAGGRGLMALERVSHEIAEHFNMEIKSVGFDTGAGMPPPIGFRDLPHVWSEGDYNMNIDKLRSRLKDSKLYIGNVLETVPASMRLFEDYPIGFVSFDLDYYSSTKVALSVFAGKHQTRIPRVICYFDDIIWPMEAFHNEYTGEMLAIKEFNEENERLKISKLNQLKWMLPHGSAWNEQIFVMHDFDHPKYCCPVRPRDIKSTQKPL